MDEIFDNSTNDPLLEFPEFESFHFDPSLPHTRPEPPDVEISLIIETDVLVINNFDELNEDECFDPGGSEINVSQIVEDDDSFTFVIRTFLPFLTYHVDSPKSKGQSSARKKSKYCLMKKSKYCQSKIEVL
ncbi:hypothetical protein Tco_0456884, partial [Tanacetum coccineum]